MEKIKIVATQKTQFGHQGIGIVDKKVVIWRNEGDGIKYLHLKHKSVFTDENGKSWRIVASFEPSDENLGTSFFVDHCEEWKLVEEEKADV